MQPETSKPEKSDLVKAIESRERTAHPFEVASFLARHAKLGQVAIRVLTVAEQEKAVTLAWNYLKKKIADSNAQNDPDIVANVKTAFALQMACRSVKDPNQPAFPTGDWLLQQLSAEELAVLLNHYNEVQRLSGPMQREFNEEQVEAIAQSCVLMSESDLPNKMLASLSPEQLGEMIIRISVKLREARDEIANLVSAAKPSADEIAEPSNDDL